MLENWQAFVQVVGFLFLGACSIVGAYVIGRWGYCGILFIARSRHDIDVAVRQEIEDATSFRHNRSSIR